MRAILLTSSLASVIAFLACSFCAGLTTCLPDFQFPLSGKINTGFPGGVDSATSVEQIVELERYDDADYGFSVAIPAGWRRIVAAEDITDADDHKIWSEQGYAVGFESPQASAHDRFADYILIEVLPGEKTGLFDSSAEHRQYIYIGENEIAYDKLHIDSELDSSTDVDLVIFQRGVPAVGYTLGFYAIGEPANERALFDAFQIMLRTFTQTADPFVII